MLVDNCLASAERDVSVTTESPLVEQRYRVFVAVLPFLPPFLHEHSTESWRAPRQVTAKGFAVKLNRNPKPTRCHNNEFLGSSCFVFLIHFWLSLYCISECLSPSGVHLSPLSPLKSVSRGGGGPYWTQADAISAYPEIELFFSKSKKTTAHN